MNMDENDFVNDSNCNIVMKIDVKFAFSVDNLHEWFAI